VVTRRDEEKAELKSVFFVRDDFGQWGQKKPTSRVI
jgi:hypothetical protein